MATLSLNGSFNYPIELKQSLIVDRKAEFNDAIQHGFNNGNAAQYSIVSGTACSANGGYSFSAGNASYTGITATFARSDGFECSGYGAYSRSYGYNACSDHERSFVWQGVRTEIPYQSKGEGTFCINPQHDSNGGSISTPICGFFVGDSCITDYISSHSAKRLLNNPNIGDGGFTKAQEFHDEVHLSGPVSSYSTVVFTDDSVVTFGGTTIVEKYNDFDSPISDAVASLRYASGIALSAITHVGSYYPIQDIGSINFDEKKDFAVSLDFLRTYVASSVNDAETFYDATSGDGSVATRGYSFNLATSASTHILSSDNSFTGYNRFRTVEITGRNKITLSNTASADFRNGNVLVKEPSELTDAHEYVPATERFARGVATSGVNFILDNGNTYGKSSSYINTYVATSRFSGPVTFYGSVSLDTNAVADFSNGTLRVKSPSPLSIDGREPSTTKFTRDTALSAVTEFLKHGGTFSEESKLVFDGTLLFNCDADFNTSGKSYVFVKTQSIKVEPSNLAASTEYVKNYVTDTLNTSAISVKKLITSGDASSNANDYTTINNFLGSTYVNTMDSSCNDRHAASCEFVKNAVNGMSMFELFDMKYKDYKYGNSVKTPWKLSGSKVTKAECPNAYLHIYNDIKGKTPQTEEVDGIVIKYYLADDGHKIVLSSNSSAVDRLFNNTGIAWYYVIDTGAECIYLPRSNYGFNISTGDVGEYVEPSLPQHSHRIDLKFSSISTGGPYPCHGGATPCRHSTSNLNTGTAIWNGDRIKEGTTVQPPATKMFLYFYCG